MPAAQPAIEPATPARRSDRRRPPAPRSSLRPAEPARYEDEVLRPDGIAAEEIEAMEAERDRYAERLNAETADPAWSREVGMRLSALLQDAGLDDQALHAVDCREAICRAVLRLPPLQADQAIDEAYEAYFRVARRSHLDTWLGAFLYEDGSWAIETFLPRDGGALDPASPVTPDEAVWQPETELADAPASATTARKATYVLPPSE